MKFNDEDLAKYLKRLWERMKEDPAKDHNHQVTYYQRAWKILLDHGKL